MTKGRDVSKSGHSRAGQQVGQVEVTSGFGMNTRVSYVEVNWPSGSGTIQLEVDEARLIAHMILEAAEAAEQDAFMFNFAYETITDADEPEAKRIALAASMLGAYRQWRDTRRAKLRTPSA